MTRRSRRRFDQLTFTVFTTSSLTPPAPSEMVKWIVRLPAVPPAVPPTVLKVVSRASCWATVGVALALKAMRLPQLPYSLLLELLASQRSCCSSRHKWTYLSESRTILRVQLGGRSRFPDSIRHDGCLEILRRLSPSSTYDNMS